MRDSRSVADDYRDSWVHSRIREYWLDAHTRAEFDVRVFAGLHLTGIDQAPYFNCRSAQEEDVCPKRPCELDQRRNRERLLQGQLPCRAD